MSAARTARKRPGGDRSGRSGAVRALQPTAHSLLRQALRLPSVQQVPQRLRRPPASSTGRPDPGADGNTEAQYRAVADDPLFGALLQRDQLLAHHEEVSEGEEREACISRTEEGTTAERHATSRHPSAPRGST